jgi:hypothetical protein
MRYYNATHQFLPERTMSRTTLSLDDEVLHLLRGYAQARSVTLGEAVSDLVRRGLAAPHPTRIVNGLHVFDLPADSPVVRMEDVLRIDADTP